jgi:hypothetical protein
MKKTMILLAIAVSSLAACTKHNPADDNSTLTAGQVEDNPTGGGGNNVSASTVPAAVTSTFNARYTDAKQIQWKQTSDGNFKAEFFRGSVKWQATFTPTGTLVKEEHK